MKIIHITLLCFLASSLFGQSKEELKFMHKGELTTKNFNKTIPITIWNDLIVIKATVNNIEGNFIWDNGFSITGIDSAFAKKINIKKVSVGMNATDGNNRNFDLKTGIAKSISIDGVKSKNEPVIIIDTKQFANNKEIKIDGLIGASFSNKMNWDFNFDKNELIFADKKFEKNGIKLHYEITQSNGHIFSMKVNGEEVWAACDFGSNDDDFSANIALSSAFQGHKSSEEYGVTSISVSGISNIDTTYVINNDYKYEIDGKTFNFYPKVKLTNNQKGFNIGNRFFRRYNTTINNNDTTYILSDRVTKINENPTKNYGVKILLSKNKLLIGKITTNPNIKGKNLTLLSEVLEINSKPISFFENQFILMDFQKNLLLENKNLILKMKDGTIHTFEPNFDNEF